MASLRRHRLLSGYQEPPPPPPGQVDCSADPGALAPAITAAKPGTTLYIVGTCVGHFVITKTLTLTGASSDARLDGGGSGTVLGIDPGSAAAVNVTVAFLTITAGNIGTAVAMATMPIFFEKNIPHLFPLTAARQMYDPLHKLKYSFAATYFDQVRSGIDPGDIDLVLVATATPNRTFPATAGYSLTRRTAATAATST